MIFKDYLSPQLRPLIKEIHTFGFEVSIVGGMVRDFYLNIPNRHDYDIEVSSKDDSIDIELHFQNLIDFLSVKYSLEELKFRVIKVKLEEFSVELTLPRVENFNDEFSHSNFIVEYVRDPDYRLSSLRRDFTINAMRYVFNGSDWIFIDPLDGLKDLKNKKLTPCSVDFIKDPVRFLRAIRFSLLYEFEIDIDIKNHLSNLKDSVFNPFYIRSESLKSRAPLHFLFHLISFIDKKSYDEELKQISTVDQDVTDLKVHLKTLCIFDETLQSRLYRLCDIKHNLPKFTYPILFKREHAETFFEFMKDSKSVELFQSMNFHSELEDKYIDNFYEQKLIDINSHDFESIKKIKMKFDSSIDPKNRKLYKAFMQLKSLT